MCENCANGQLRALGVYCTKDSGMREEFASGMKRDTQAGKPRYDLIWRPGLKRLAELYARGSEKYTAKNWMKACSQEELDRFKASANRHFEAWFQGQVDEDHMSGCIFNLFGAEYVKEQMIKSGVTITWI
jgi:hypothetical protein